MMRRIEFSTAAHQAARTTVGDTGPPSLLQGTLRWYHLHHTLAAGVGRTGGGGDGASPHWGPGSSCARLAEGAAPRAPAGVNLAEGVAQRVLVRARAGARLSAVLAEVVAQRGGDCGAVALLPLAPRFGIDRVEV